jgi:hypothetical protein
MKQERDIRTWWTDSLRLNFPSGTFGPIVPTYTTLAYGSSNSSKFSRMDYEDIGVVHKHTATSASSSPWRSSPRDLVSFDFFIRQLTGYNAPLASNDINDLTGDIAT